MGKDIIYREDAIEALKGRENIPHDAYTAVAIIRSIPSADRPQGEWIRATGVAPPEFTGRYICSNCGDYALMNMPYGSRQEMSRFCPNCGARMKWGDNE